MKVGLFINTQFPEGDNIAARVPELVEQVRVAREMSASTSQARAVARAGGGDYQ
jgi:hypothetical protein